MKHPYDLIFAVIPYLFFVLVVFGLPAYVIIRLLFVL